MPAMEKVTVALPKEEMERLCAKYPGIAQKIRKVEDCTHMPHIKAGMDEFYVAAHQEKKQKARIYRIYARMIEHENGTKRKIAKTEENLPELWKDKLTYWVKTKE